MELKMNLAVKFCQDLLPSLEDSVIFELKCATCKEVMLQPIFHCERGHSSCEKCYKTGDICQYCGCTNKGNRTHHLERILEILTYPCKYFGQGCQKRCHPKKLRLHESECQTYKFPCPLKEGTKCTFTGTRKQIVFHCQLVHSEFTFVGDKVFKQRILHANFLMNKTYHPLRRSNSAETIIIIMQSVNVYSFKDFLFQGVVQLEPTRARVRIGRISPPSEMDATWDFFLVVYDFDDDVIGRFRKQCCVTDGWQEASITTKSNYIEIDLEVLEYCRYFTIEFIHVCN